MIDGDYNRAAFGVWAGEAIAFVLGLLASGSLNSLRYAWAHVGQYRAYEGKLMLISSKVWHREDCPSRIYRGDRI